MQITVIPAKAGIQTPVCPGKQQPARNLRAAWLPHAPIFLVRGFGFPRLPGMTGGQGNDRNLHQAFEGEGWGEGGIRHITSLAYCGKTPPTPASSAGQALTLPLRERELLKDSAWMV